MHSGDDSVWHQHSPTVAEGMRWIDIGMEVNSFGPGFFFFLLHVTIELSVDKDHTKKNSAFTCLFAGLATAGRRRWSRPFAF